MKVEDIKLALDKNRETRVQFNLKDTGYQMEQKAGNSLTLANGSLYQSFVNKLLDARGEYSEAKKNYEQYIVKAKEIGADSNDVQKRLQLVNQNIKSIEQKITKLKSL